jgi:uncharacterized protein (TIGR00251 family)
MAAWRSTDAGALLTVRVRPGTRRQGIGGLQALGDGGEALQVAVNAAPEKGKANKAVITVLAKHFGFAKSTLGVVTGTTGRTKQILISGDPDRIANALAAGLADLNKE